MNVKLTIIGIQAGFIKMWWTIRTMQAGPLIPPKQGPLIPPTKKVGPLIPPPTKPKSQTRRRNSSNSKRKQTARPKCTASRKTCRRRELRRRAAEKRRRQEKAKQQITASATSQSVEEASVENGSYLSADSGYAEYLALKEESKHKGEIIGELQDEINALEAEGERYAAKKKRHNLQILLKRMTNMNRNFQSEPIMPVSTS